MRNKQTNQSSAGDKSIINGADLDMDEMFHPLNIVHVELVSRSYDVHIAEGCHTWLHSY